MRRVLLISLGLLGLTAAWLIAAPVPIDPVAWTAPVDRGLTGAFTPNDLLEPLRATPFPDHHGPEDAALGRDGYVYTTSEEGDILRISPSGQTVSVYAQVGGRPLGIEATADGKFFIANAYLGVQRINADGKVEALTMDGAVPSYTNDLAIARDGTLYVSDASTKFSPRDHGGTLPASLLDIMEHRPNGRVLKVLPGGRVEVIADQLHFANGVALSRDEQFLLIAETANYRIVKLWLDGPRAGEREIVLDNLPGFPDNINNGLQNRFWVGLVAPRNALVDRWSDQPWLRKVVQRLPSFLRPKPEPSTHVISINGDGEVLMSLQDAASRYPQITGAIESREFVYLTSLTGSALPRIAKQDLYR